MKPTAKVRCTHCGKVLASFSAGAQHVRSHPPIVRGGRSRWGSGAYTAGQTWEAYMARTDPPNHAQMGTGEVADSPPIRIVDRDASRIHFPSEPLLHDEYGAYYKRK